MKASAFANSILNFIYTPKCMLCRRVMADINEARICVECERALERIEPPFCAKCGRSFGGSEGGICAKCESAGFEFNRCGALWPYSGKQARSVLDLKFNNRLENGKSLGILCAEDIMKKGFSSDINIIIPVPLHKSKMSKRGYNQSEIIARAIGKRLNTPVDTVSVIRIKKTVPQMDLNQEQRLVNVNGSMKVYPEDIAGKNVLLIDDIFTTGSTLNECARELKKAGAKTVNCYCVCTTH